MRIAITAIATFFITGAAPAAEPDRETLLEFIAVNEIDTNLYNLLAATIPSTPGGQALFKACGSLVTEDLFENAYAHVRETMGVVWRGALADIYARHLTEDDLKRFSTLPDATRMTAISGALTAEPVVADLRATLSPLVVEATGRHLNHMIDEADGLCNTEN